jgi:hypothetical protein
MIIIVSVGVGCLCDSLRCGVDKGEVKGIHLNDLIESIKILKVEKIIKNLIYQ